MICSSVSLSPRSVAESRLFRRPRAVGSSSASASSIKSAISALVSKWTPLLMSLGPIRSSPAHHCSASNLLVDLQ